MMTMTTLPVYNFLLPGGNELPYERRPSGEGVYSVTVGRAAST